MTEKTEIIVKECARKTKCASYILAQTSTKTINAVLKTLTENISQSAEHIIAENTKDITLARDKGLSDALIDRLLLTPERIEFIASSVETIIALDDPTGKILWQTQRPNGLKIERVSCPIGVIGMIYESRPNVTIDAAILCLKSHNAVVLRGGSESFHSASALHKIIQDALEEHSLPKNCVSMIPTTDRQAVSTMLECSNDIDVIIPRGGMNLIKRVMDEAKMPVFSHLNGICHVYVHHAAKADIARNVILNAKMRRTGICGAAETILLDDKLDKSIAKDVLSTLIESGCDIVGDGHTQSLHESIMPATDDDWGTEYLSEKISCKFVDSIEDAVKHINTYGSHHTDSILTEDNNAAQYFQHNVDSGIVMHNTSTQFADGGEFGMGAEIGIATGKMHARGPVGLEQLCTYKYFVHGNGQIRPE